MVKQLIEIEKIKYNPCKKLILLIFWMTLTPGVEKFFIENLRFFQIFTFFE